MSTSAAPATAGSSRITVAAALLRLRSDEQLVAAFRQGQEAAFQVIHDRYKARLFAYARQMLGGSPQDAEDALQDVFLRAYNALRADARPITLRAWLYRVAHNRCIDQMRRPAPVPVEASEDSPSDAPEPMVAAQQREDLRRLVTDIRALPQQQRSALLMREMDGMTYTELGAALGVSIPAVKSLLVRARMGLAETGEARDADCHEICADLASSHDRGVRSSGRARRHLRDCHGCRAYRVALKGTSTAIAALSPASPGLLAGLAQALGLGGAGSGALVGGGGGAVATGSSVLAVGATTTKVAAVLGAAAVALGGAAEVEERIASPAAPERAAAPPPVVPPVAGAPTPDTVARVVEADVEREETERDEEREETERDEEHEVEREEEQETDSNGATAPEQPVAQAPDGGGSGDGSSGGSSGGGQDGGAEGAVRETTGRGERLLDVPGRAVTGLLDTLRRTTEPGSSDGPAKAEQAAGEPAGAKGNAAGNDRGGEPERRPRGTE